MLRYSSASLLVALLATASAIAGCTAAASTGGMPAAASYPACSLPSPYRTTNYAPVAYAGLFQACVDVSAQQLPGYDHMQAWDLDSLQLIVAGKCYDAVTKVTFGGTEYMPSLIKYEKEGSVGVEISAKHPLATYEQLSKKPEQLCIFLKSPCAGPDSLYNTILYAPYGTQPAHYNTAAPQCASATLFPSNGHGNTPQPSTAAPQAYPQTLPRAMLNVTRTSRALLGCPQNLQCGTDKPGNDRSQYFAPGATPSGDSKAFAEPDTFTILDCCQRCQQDKDTFLGLGTLKQNCNSFIIRGGVCFLKGFALHEYPPSAPGIGCPPANLLALNTQIKDVGQQDTIIGAPCAC